MIYEGDRVQIKQVPGVLSQQQVMEFGIDKTYVVEWVEDYGDFQGIQVNGLPYMMTNKDVIKV